MPNYHDVALDFSGLRGELHTISTVSFGPVECLVGRLQQTRGAFALIVVAHGSAHADGDS
jgi:hypothetical protein